MRHIYPSRAQAFSLACVALLGGCQTVPPQAAAAPYVAPVMATPSGPNPYAGYPVYPTQPVAAPYAAEDSQALKERLERIEKAMLRLDRRMQLVERNELQRMTTGQPINQLSQNNAAEPNEAILAGSYQPVAANEGITSALQAAPSRSQPPLQLASAAPAPSGLPSLADPLPTAGQQPGTAKDVAIWTVRYAPSKVWPDRTQLPASREVVEALRGNGSVTLFARGKNANAVEFRERVRALSRYLAKVSSLDTVPIAALPAPHLDNETIEIMATH